MQINTNPATLTLAPTQDPIVLDDITNVVMFAYNVKKRKFDAPTSIANEDVANAALMEHRAIGKFAGTDNALALNLRLDEMVRHFDQRLDGIDQRLDGMVQRGFNGTAIAVGDEIGPPSNGVNPAPAHFPGTIQAIKDLPVGPPLTEVEDFYGLQHTGNIIARKNRVRRAYGIGMLNFE